MKISKKALFSLVLIVLSCNASAEFFDFISKIKLKNDFRKIKNKVKKFNHYCDKNKKDGETLTKITYLKKLHYRKEEEIGKAMREARRIHKEDKKNNPKNYKKDNFYECPERKKALEIKNLRRKEANEIITKIEKHENLSDNHYDKLKNKSEKIINDKLNKVVFKCLQNPKLFETLNESTENDLDLKKFFDIINFNFEKNGKTMIIECLQQNNHDKNNNKLKKCLNGTFQFVKNNSKTEESVHIILEEYLEKETNRKSGYTLKSNSGKILEV